MYPANASSGLAPSDPLGHVVDFPLADTPALVGVPVEQNPAAECRERFERAHARRADGRDAVDMLEDALQRVEA